MRKQFFAISALSTLLGAKWFHLEPRKTTFLKFFIPWRFFISVPGLNYHFCKHRFSEILKTDFFRKIFDKTAISASRTVDKTENAKNNEIKILVWPPESLKSHKTVFSDNHSHKLLEQCETQRSFRNFYLRKIVLISSGKSNDVKIRIWSKSLGTRLLRTTGVIEIPWRPKIPSPKS